MNAPARLPIANIRRGPAAPGRQRGATLLAGLIFLIILTLIGVTASRVSILEERMAGNLRDRAVALQAAEMALRDAERDLSGEYGATNPRPDNIENLGNFSEDCGASTGGSDDDDGLCYNGADGYASGDEPWITNSMTGAPSVEYGQFTDAQEIPLVSAQPRYVIEGTQRAVAGSGDDKTYYYRITVRAQGIDSNTVVWLQETYRP
ncbi:MAG: PilX N-terminal domain-containing pilus assembly protein [Pseudomonadota bacterium]